MTVSAPVRRRSGAVLRVGYLIGAAVNAALLYLVNGWPGWQQVPVLTGDTRQVLGLVNLSLAAGLAANLVYVAYHPGWLRIVGDAVTSGIGLAVTVRVLQVFPFDLHGGWVPAVRGLLVVAAVGTGIAVLVHVVALLRWLATVRAPVRR